MNTEFHTTQTENEYYLLMDTCNVPFHTRQGLIDWMVYHRPPGGFLQNLLANNLLQTLSKADNINKNHIGDILSFLYNHAPSQCWGSPENVAEWCDEKYRGMLEPHNVVRASIRLLGRIV